MAPPLQARDQFVAEEKAAVHGSSHFTTHLLIERELVEPERVSEFALDRTSGELFQAVKAVMVVPQQQLA